MVIDPRPRPLAGSKGNAFPPETPLPSWFSVVTPAHAIIAGCATWVLADFVFPALFGWEPVDNTWGERVWSPVFFLAFYGALRLAVLGVQRVQAWHSGRSETSG